MAVTLPGTGTPVASKTVGSDQVQLIQPCFGGSGVATPVTATEPLPVTVISGGDGSVQGVDAHDSAVTADPATIGGYASAAAPTNVSADGDAVRAWFLRNGAQCQQLTAAGALIGGDATNGLDVDVTRLPALPAGTNNIGDVDVLTLPGVAGTAAHDAVASGNPLLIGGFASAAAPTSVSADADVVRAWYLRNGAQATVVTAAGALIGGDATNGLDVDVTRLPGTIGGVAHDAAASGSNPLLGGIEARTAVGTAVASADLVRTLGDVFGKQVVIPGALFEESLGPTCVNFTTTSAADLIAAQGAGIKIVVTSILVVNGHATQGTKVTVRDKTTTAKRYVGYAAALGGGWNLSNPRGLLIGDANSAIEALCGTSGADVDVTIAGYLIRN